MSDGQLEQLRRDLIAAAQGDDVDAVALAAGRLTAALIRAGHGSADWERALARLAYRDVELAAIADALHALERLGERGRQKRALGYILRRLGIETYQID